MHYVVIERHRSEYPRPIRFAKGTLLDIGPRYEGEPGWQDWYLCSCPGQEPGWVPAQLIERFSVEKGRALDHYSAHELDADPGQLVQKVRSLNGWMWCRRHDDDEFGWLPLAKLEQLS
ncbi:SH3 domain-containing protein [Pseudomonas kermanshahensis]|jgi:Protein containing a metal-binding domain shared with formylmethanofuran dehydrogenase subunit E|uniref:SH3 domain-containing protein n=1 Tax=Pseudomonas kermanshahensis TaxID=2745482 RepID=A0ABU8R110_9PSED|nr:MULTISPECIES: SH3 domain-containing protein [Pseudomonas]ATP45794.1 ligand-binding protein SH3 [Pseudomonas putida]MBC3487227.1 ligand-binding protein SH3 [Pseudomonas sp. SWRI50]MBC3499227.1 ligand-binding protein SH3 [Pseudomonas sp. SWRI67]MBV4525988.1 ligand-binding protein SH3 [Pseudomonas kermanshahensis]MCX2684873.1 SH3 domain-containing protein [Pseudomonas sp. DCB_AW]